MDCTRCGKDVLVSDKFCAVCGEPIQQAVYFPVSPRYLAIISILTWGLYPTYWFYKNWVFIRERDRSNIWPWARALFSPFYYESLARDLAGSRTDEYVSLGRELAEGQSTKRVVPVGFVILYFVLAYTVTRLPEPFDWLGLLAFAPLLPAVKHINRLNEENVVWSNSQPGSKLIGILIFSVPTLCLALYRTF